MKISRKLCFASVLTALAGLVFAAEPSVVVVDKSFNAEVVAVQSIQAIELVDLQSLEIAALQPVSDFVIATSDSMFSVTDALLAVADPERLCRTETSESNRTSLTATVSDQRSISEVQKLTGTSAKTLKI